MFSRRLFIFWVTITCLLLIGFGQKNHSSIATAQAQPAKLTISAAASLKEAMQDIKQLYSQQQPNVTLTYNFGSSGSLQQQIDQGAPVDIFISAASKQMDALEKQGLIIADTRKNLLKNQVVLIVSKNNQTISDFKDLANSNVKRVALGEPKSVPVGQYAQEVLTALGIFDRVKPKAVFAKDVRQVLTYVEAENVDAGFVYTTDAQLSDRVRVVATAADNLHSPIVYPIAVLKRSQNATDARDFIEFLDREQAKSVFKKYGFITNP